MRPYPHPSPSPPTRKKKRTNEPLTSVTTHTPGLATLLLFLHEAHSRVRSGRNCLPPAPPLRRETSSCMHFTTPHSPPACPQHTHPYKLHIHRDRPHAAAAAAGAKPHTQLGASASPCISYFSPLPPSPSISQKNPHPSPSSSRGQIDR